MNTTTLLNNSIVMLRRLMIPFGRVWAVNVLVYAFRTSKSAVSMTIGAPQARSRLERSSSSVGGSLSDQSDQPIHIRPKPNRIEPPTENVKNIGPAISIDRKSVV